MSSPEVDEFIIYWLSRNPLSDNVKLRSYLRSKGVKASLEKVALKRKEIGKKDPNHLWRTILCTKLPENCPACGEKLEEGYISAPASAIIRWDKKKPMPTGIGGEKLVKDWTLGICVEAYRCQNCKIVMFYYGP